MYHISQIVIYPVKSLGGVPVQSVAVEPRGLRGDRRWMIVDEKGSFITRRECPALAGIDVHVLGDDSYRLRIRDGRGEAILPRTIMSENRHLVKVWRDRVEALLVYNEASQLISEVAGRAVALAYMPDDSVRPVDQAYGAAADSVSFADGFPILLTSEVSLDALNQRLEHPIAMERFRPNLVIGRRDGPLPWEERTWRSIHVGEVALDLVKPCSRCVVITQDHEMGTQPDGNAPLRALRALNQIGREGVLFGQNAIPRSGGIIAVGDDLSAGTVE